ncbi:MAG: glycosyltransferase family 2 protein, partial [Acidimicrobiia bacterium]
NSGRPRITAVVVTYNSAELLGDFFGAMRMLEDDFDLEIVVSDNASTDGSADLARQLYEDVTVVESEENRGYAAGINAGVRGARPSDAILVLNDDIRFRPESLGELYAALGDPATGIAVPKLIDGDGELLKSLRRAPSISRTFGEAVLGGKRAGLYAPLGEVVEDTAAYSEPADVAWASGCAWLISRSCWDDVGEWDESFFLYAEDTEYALRARQFGHVVRYVPSAIAVHLVGPSHRDPRLWTMSVWNRYRLFKRTHGPVQSGLFRFGLLVNESIRAAAGRSVHRAAAEAIVNPSKLPDEVR